MEYEFRKNEAGIVLDYMDRCFYINIYDEDFTPYEINALKHNRITIYFKKFHLVSMFMINIDNCMETSDMPFSISEADDSSLIDSLEDDRLCYNVSVNYVRTDGTAVLNRTLTLNEAFSSELRKNLREALEYEYSAEAFDRELDRICTKYQPFEIEELCEDVLIFSK